MGVHASDKNRSHSGIEPQKSPSTQPAVLLKPSSGWKALRLENYREGCFSKFSFACTDKTIFSLVKLLGLHQRRRDDNKNESCVFFGGGGIGAEENRPITLLFLGNAMTKQNWKCEFYCRENLLLRRLLLKSRGFR